MTAPVVLRRPIGDAAPEATLYYGQDCRHVLRGLPEQSIQCCVTSPPYWGLRAYDAPPSVWGGDPSCEHEWESSSIIRKGSTNGREDLGSTLVSKGADKTLAPGLENDHGETEQYRADHSEDCRRCGAWRGHLGLEPSPELYVAHLVEVFQEVWRVLRDDGTLWLNLGDSYCTVPHGRKGRVAEGIKHKDLVGIPWMVAFALRGAGWYWRSEILWVKSNAMPESVTDRPTRAHEAILLLTKEPHYFYDHVAILEPFGDKRQGAAGGKNWETPERRSIAGKRRPQEAPILPGKNRRDWWLINPKPYPGAHFAVFPPELPKRCLLAGTSEKGCCPTCKAPWERVIERGPPPPEPDHREPPKRLEQGQAGNVGHGGMGFRASRLSGKEINAWRIEHPDKTVGWQPTCSCKEERPVPCTVLDPFSGSGTTGDVALTLGRNYVGIDASYAYLELAKARILGEAPPRAAKKDEDTANDLLALFEVEA